MLNWEEIIQRYIIKYSNQIRKTTQPLRDYFGIGYFSYHKIDENGRYTVLVDRPDWAEHYVGEKIYLHDPYLRQMGVYQSGICAIESNGSDEYKEKAFREGKKVLEMDQAIVLIQKQAGFAEFFSFSGNRKSSSLEKIYLNDPQLLNSFASYFKANFAKVLEGMQEEADSLLNLKGQDFLSNEQISTEIALPDRLSFLEKIGMQAEVEKAAKLTSRERQCLKILLQNKKIKDVAVHLGLSERTVEFYMENIKNKLTCWSQKEVLSLASRLESLGLL